MSDKYYGRFIGNELVETYKYNVWDDIFELKYIYRVLEGDWQTYAGYNWRFIKKTDKPNNDGIDMSAPIVMRCKKNFYRYDDKSITRNNPEGVVWFEKTTDCYFQNYREILAYLIRYTHSKDKSLTEYYFRKALRTNNHKSLWWDGIDWIGYEKDLVKAKYVKENKDELFNQVERIIYQFDI